MGVSEVFPSQAAESAYQVCAGEVLIRAQAASVNPFDCAVRAGYLTGWYVYDFPLILGLNVAVDAVFDAVGYDTQQRSWQVLKPGGILLSIVQAPSQETADAYGVRQQMVAAGQAGGELLSKFAAMVDAGQLKVTVSTVLPLSEIQRAHTLVEARHMRGKLVLDIAN